MADLTLAARLMLAAVFAVAAIAKLIDREGARQAVAAFDLPQPAVAPTAAVLPLAELAVATSLLLARTAVVGASGALILLALFVAGITHNLARGRQPDCRCFGQVHSAPVSGKTLVRNLALVALAILVMVNGPGTALRAWVSGMSALGWATLLVAVILAVAFVVEGSALVKRFRNGPKRK